MGFRTCSWTSFAAGARGSRTIWLWKSEWGVHMTGGGTSDSLAPEATTTFLGPRTVAYACSTLRAKLVHISSSCVYGIPSPSVVDETAPHRARHRKDAYALAKIAAERLLQQCCKDRGLEAAILQ